MCLGATVGGLASRGLSRGRLALVLALLSVLPDADVLGLRLGVPYGHPLGHRGFSHSLAFALLCGVATPRSLSP